MSTVEQLFDQYVQAFRSGDKDPRPFLRAAPDGEREELGQLIELFLLRAAPQEWDSSAYAGSDAERLTDKVLPRVFDRRTGWNKWLPELRMKQQQTRDQISMRLAEVLEARGAEQVEKVHDYYHDMEYGNLTSQVVSKRVLISLAEIYGTSVDALRRAGEWTEPPDAYGQVFARMVDSTDEGFAQSSPGRRGFSRISGKPDRIDRLFTEPDFDDLDR
jgi:hypothetical protein